MKTDYNTFPGHCADGMQRWIENGIYPGGFLTAVLLNDLKGAVGSADSINIKLLPDIVKWIYNDAPLSCWGSSKKVLEWAAHNGLKGLGK